MFNKKNIFVISLLLMSKSLFAASPPPVIGKNAMVVTAHHLATEVGVNVLKQGGNAIDAAVAVGYALAVVNPCCGNIGGGGFMLIRLANGKNIFINFREKAPRALTAQLYLQKYKKSEELPSSEEHRSGDTRLGYLTVGVPGTVLGLNTALRKYGTLPLKQLLQPAINLAKNGFILIQDDIDVFKTTTDAFKEQPNVAAIFLKNNRPYAVGDKFIQKDLANTLTIIAKQNSKGFYQGNIVKKIVAASQKQNGFLTEKDFADYTIEERPVIKCNYRGYEIISSPPPSSGGVVICQTLNIAEGYPLSKFGFHSAAATHYTLEAMRFAYADRNSFLGDPNFVKNPIEKLISEKYAEKIRQKIKPNKATNSKTIGFIAQPDKEGHNTTSYSIIDKWGNAVVVTYTVNHFFGAKVIAGDTGFFLNNELDDFTLKPGIPNSFNLIENSNNALAPGKRPLSSMSPTIILKDKKLFMILGTPGGSTIPTQLIQTIQNVIDYKMNIKQAVDAARFHMQWLPDEVNMEPYTFSADTLKILENMGYRFIYGVPFESLYWGGVMAIVKNPDTGVLEGAADAREEGGLAAGY